METKLGVRLRSLRHERGLTQEALASQLGVTYQAVSKWENNTTMPDVAMLPQIAMVLGVTIDALFSVDRTDEVRRVDLILQQNILSDEQFSYAARVLDAVLRDDPDDTDAKKRYLRLYLLRRHSDRLVAEEILSKLWTAGCDDAQLYYDLRELCGGGSEVRHADNTRFVGVSTDYVKSHPAEIKVREYLFEALLELRRYDDASALTENLPTDDIYSAYLPEIWCGDLLLAHGNTDGAAAVWKTVPASNHKGQYEVGVRLERLGDTDGAASCFEASFAAAEVPRDLSAMYSLAFLRERQGNIRGAIDTWETILSVLASDWNKTDGEDVDWPRIEICRLRAML